MTSVLRTSSTSGDSRERRFGSVVVNPMAGSSFAVRPSDECMSAVNAKTAMAISGGVSTDGRARPTPMPSTAPATRKSIAISEIGSQPACV